MTPLHAWAARWRLPPEAVHELHQALGLVPIDPPPPGGAQGSEAAAQTAIRLEASRKGVKLFRNNVGALKDEYGRLVRYGLANDSAAMNKVLKSGDLIGVKPVRIEPAHVGRTFGLFVSREVKRAGWRYTGQGREPAQLAWVNLINSCGGDAAFATGEGTL